MQTPLPRHTFIAAIEAGIEAAALSESGRGFTADDLAALRAVGATAKRSQWGSAGLAEGNPGCPAKQAGLWTVENIDRIGDIPFRCFYSTFDRFLMDNRTSAGVIPFEVID